MTIKKDSKIFNTVYGSVVDFYGFNSSSGIEYIEGNLKSFSLEKAIDDPTEIKAGKKGNVAYVISNPGSVDISLTSVEINPYLESAKLGSEIKKVGTDNIISYEMPKNYPIGGTTALTITLDHEPLEGEVVVFYNPKTKAMVDPSKVARAGKVITVTETGVAKGDTLKSTGFKYLMADTDEYSTITAEDTAPSLYVVMEQDMYSLPDFNLVAKRKIVLPKCKLLSNVTLTGESERGEQNIEHKLKVMQDIGRDDLGYVTIEYV